MTDRSSLGYIVRREMPPGSPQRPCRWVRHWVNDSVHRGTGKRVFVTLCGRDTAGATAYRLGPDWASHPKRSEVCAECAAQMVLFFADDVSALSDERQTEELVRRVSVEPAQFDNFGGQLYRRGGR